MDLNLIGSEYVDEYEGQESVLTQSSASRDESGTKVYRTIVRWALMAGVFLVPVFFLPWTTSILEFNKGLLVLAVAGVGLIAWLLSLVSSGWFSWRPNVFNKGVLAILGATLLATIFSVSRFNSLFGTANNYSSSLMMAIAFTVIYFLIINSVQDEGRSLTRIIATSLTLVLLFGVLQVVGIHIFKYLNLASLKFTDSFAFNSIGTVNSLGVIAAISLPLLGGVRASGWRRYFQMLGVVLAIGLLIVLNWWILWTVAIVGMVAWIALESIAHDRFNISRFILPMTVIVIGVFMMVVNIDLNAIRSNLPTEVAPTFQLSGHVVQSALKENLLTGYGPTTFSLAFDKYGASKLVDSTISDAKFYAGTSEVFNAIAGGGILMALAILVMVWAMIQGVRWFILNKEIVHRTNAQYVWATLLALCAAYLLYPFNMTLMFLLYVVLALAVLSIWGSTAQVYDTENSVAISVGSTGGFIGGLILVLIGAYFGASAYIGDFQFAKALNETDINKASVRLVSAANWNSGNDVYFRTASQAAIGLLSQELNKKADKSDTQQQTRIQNYSSSAVNLAKRATELGPRESLNWNNLGNVYQNLLGLVGGVDTLSADAYKKAAALRPGDPSFYNKIGGLYLAESQFIRQAASGSQSTAQLNKQAADALATAETNFKKAIDLSNNYGLAIYNLGIVYDQQGKLPAAIKQLEKVAPFNTDQPNLGFELGLLYYRNGDKTKAFDSMQQVLALEPKFANARWYLALIYEERKDIPNAIDQLKQILAVPENKDNQTVLDKLQLLRAGEVSPVKGINQEPL